MPWARHRGPLLLAAALDALGLVAIALGVIELRYSRLEGQAGLLAALVLIYWTLGWLFGSYTTIRLPQLAWTQLAVRLGSTGAASVVAAALLAWLIRASPELTLLHRGTLLPLFALMAFWSAAVRLLLRRLRSDARGQRWWILALPGELPSLGEEWTRMPAPRTPPVIRAYHVNGERQDLLPNGPEWSVALSPGVAAEEAMRGLCQQVVERGLPVTSLAEMAEQELQRIPPRWVGDQWLLFSSRIEGRRTTLQQQLKRYADVVISLSLLLLTAPLLLLAALLIRLQDGGPVFYRQRRTGLLGEPLDVLKLRTMVPAAERHGAQWAASADPRITPVGAWLRRTRLDELPQLLNVLRGEMSLIGPRPERPELERQLEEAIPNYRLRHWIRPGLSGWAQVNMPYGASVEDAERKLGYDLFYLRNASIWLDLLILFKTIKTVLKAGGR